MLSHLAGVGEPYPLPSGVMYFHDWRWTQPGRPRWRTPAGEGVPLFAPDPPPPMSFEYTWGGTPGLRLKALPSRQGKPVISSTSAPPWMAYIAGANVLYDGGRYRAWVECVPTQGWREGKPGNSNLCCYAESDDGDSWRFPSLGLVEHNGSKANNIVCGGALTPVTGFHGHGIFIDPSAPAAERYKTFYLAKLKGSALEKYLRERPGDVDPMAVKKDEGWAWALLGGVSPDGLRWTMLDEPLLIQNSDTHNVCDWDATRRTYVAYVRMWIMGRRAIGRTESPDFRRFPRPEVVLWPRPEDDHTVFWYSSGKTAMPSSPEHHVMFPLRWNVSTDKFDFFLAASPDNVTWNLVPGGPVVAPGPAGSWDAGVTTPCSALVDLPGNRTALMYTGTPISHKYPRHPPFGELAWATWERERLVALECPAEGRFQTVQVLCPGRTVRLNYRTYISGCIRVEALGADGKALPGRSFDDCDPVSGNEFDRVVTWKGASGLNLPEGAPLSLRLTLRAAELFAIHFSKD